MSIPPEVSCCKCCGEARSVGMLSMRSEGLCRGRLVHGLPRATAAGWAAGHHHLLRPPKTVTPGFSIAEWPPPWLHDCAQARGRELVAPPPELCKSAARGTSRRSSHSTNDHVGTRYRSEGARRSKKLQGRLLLSIPVSEREGGRERRTSRQERYH